MAAVKQSYFLAPSWDLKPEEVALGSVVADFTCPQRALSTHDLPSHIDTQIHIQEQPISGSVRTERKWSVGIFATFIQVASGLDISYSDLKSMEIKYSCASMKTQRFMPSSAYIDQAAKDNAVRNYLEIAGLGAKVFVITGIKTASQIEITTTHEKQHEATEKLGLDMAAVQLSVGPKASCNTSKNNSHTTMVKGPIVFAIQVGKLRLRKWSNRVVSKEHIAGAMLEMKASEKYIVERTAGDLEEEETEDFGARTRRVVDEEACEECEVTFLGDVHNDLE